MTNSTNLTKNSSFHYKNSFLDSHFNLDQIQNFLKNHAQKNEKTHSARQAAVLIFFLFKSLIKNECFKTKSRTEALRGKVGAKFVWMLQMVLC